jgi:hypothetical protein
MPRPVRLLALLAAAAALTAAACHEASGTAGPNFVSTAVRGGSTLHDLRTRQQQWAALGLADYDYDFAAVCFCAPSFTQPAVVHVRGGRVVRVTPRGDHPAAPLDAYPTIDDLFARAVAALERDDVVEGEFDRLYGYPTSITIGTLANDAGTAYTVANVRMAR